MIIKTHKNNEGTEAATTSAKIHQDKTAIVVTVVKTQWNK
jgi:hypothetical protein